MTNHTKQFESIVIIYVEQYNMTKDPFIKKKLKEGLKATLRKMTDQKVNMVSEAAMIACNKKDIDPFELLWPERNILGKDENGKSLLLWEHTTPLGELCESIISSKSKEEILKVITSYSGVCWVTREEDNKLNKAGFRSSRVNGWKSAYEQCGINVVYKD